MDRNNVTTISEKQITDFEELKFFVVRNNKLSKDTQKMLKDLKSSRSDIKIEFDEDEEAEQVIAPELMEEFLA